MSFNITPVASGYQEIHPYSAMNIGSVKINTSLIMMKECISLPSVFYPGQCVFTVFMVMEELNERSDAEKIFVVFTFMKSGEERKMERRMLIAERRNA